MQPGNTIKLVPVQPGTQVGSSIVIDSGLKGGEQIVTEGLDKLREGAPVSPQLQQTADTQETGKPAAASTVAEKGR